MQVRLREIEKRLSEIKAEAEKPETDLDALDKEVDALVEERKAIEAKIEKRKGLMNKVAGGAGHVENGFEGIEMEAEKRNGVDSAEYRSAFLKNLLGSEMSKEERAAFVHTTGNTTAPVPAQMLDKIWDLVTKQHNIMSDITIYRTGVAIELVKHTEVVAGKAKKVGENEANVGEQNTFVKVTLTGHDFSKHVEISYAMANMAIDAFAKYIENEIAKQLGEAMADDVMAQISEDTSAENKFTTATSGLLTFKELAKAFGMLKNATKVVVYATREVIYNQIVGMTDANGRPIFQPNAQQGAAGYLLGAEVKEEASVGAGKIAIGDPSKVAYNMVTDIMIEKDKDTKKHVHIYSGYARGEGALVDDKAFAEITIKA